MVTEHGMRDRDAEVVVAGGALLHDVGMSIHRADHEAYSLFLAQERLQSLLADCYEDPERTVVIGEILHSIIGHRRKGEPYTVEAGVVGRRRPRHGRGALADPGRGRPVLDPRALRRGDRRGSDRGGGAPVKVEIEMNNSAGIFQVDDLLATKLRGTPLEGHLEVIAQVKGETEKRLLPSFRL